MNLKDVNHFLGFMFVVSVVVAMVVLVVAIRSDGWPCQSSNLQVKEVPLTRGPEFPSSTFPGQMHVTLNRVGKLDCVWIFNSEVNDWLALGGPGCPTVEPPGCLLDTDTLIEIVDEEYSLCITEEGELYLNPDPWIKAGREAAKILGYNPYLEDPK